MRIGSLFSGIGGLDWPWRGHDFRWLSEIDKDACKVLEVRFPGIPNLGDITQIEWSKVEPIDVLIGGGFPCQPFSVAGQRKGKADERYLWPFIADAIGALGPRLVVLENVAGILGMPEWGAVVGSLADLGYDCRWTVVRASDIGAPHQRARVFALAYPAGVESLGRSSGLGGWPGETEQARLGGKGASDSCELGRRPGAGSSPSGPGELRGDGFGDDGGASIARGWEGAPASHSRFLDRTDGRLRGGWENREEASEPRRDRSWGPYLGAVTRWERIHGPAPDPTDGGRLNPVFVEWMMGFPRGWVTDLAPRRAGLRMLGNAVVPHQAIAAMEMLE